MLRKSGMDELDFRYYANSELTSWPRLLATLCILATEEVNVRAEIERHNETQSSRQPLSRR